MEDKANNIYEIGKRLNKELKESNEFSERHTISGLRLVEWLLSHEEIVKDDGEELGRLLIEYRIIHHEQDKYHFIAHKSKEYRFCQDDDSILCPRNEEEHRTWVQGMEIRERFLAHINSKLKKKSVITMFSFQREEYRTIFKGRKLLAWLEKQADFEENERKRFLKTLCRLGLLLPTSRRQEITFEQSTEYQFHVDTLKDINLKEAPVRRISKHLDPSTLNNSILGLEPDFIKSMKIKRKLKRTDSEEKMKLRESCDVLLESTLNKMGPQDQQPITDLGCGHMTYDVQSDEEVLEDDSQCGSYIERLKYQHDRGLLFATKSSHNMQHVARSSSLKSETDALEMIRRAQFIQSLANIDRSHGSKMNRDTSSSLMDILGGFDLLSKAYSSPDQLNRDNSLNSYVCSSGRGSLRDSIFSFSSSSSSVSRSKFYVTSPESGVESSQESLLDIGLASKGTSKDWDCEVEKQLRFLDNLQSLEDLPGCETAASRRRNRQNAVRKTGKT